MAVINNRTECFFNSIRQKQGIVLFFVLCGAGFAYCNPTACDLVKKDVQETEFSHNLLENQLVLSRPANGPVCWEGSCCKPEIEQNMLKNVQTNIDKFLRESITKLANIIDTRAKKFDELFKSMMKKSKIEFHSMFERTYGKIYLQNSDVFSNFFDELDNYYKMGSTRLTQTLDNFFDILYQRMFLVLNSQYNFNDTYLECVSKYMDELQPFGDVPHKLTVQLRRSFVATRTFFKSLIKAVEIAESFVNLKVDPECYGEATRMQYCGLCKGENGEGACSNYCSATMENCMKIHIEFSAHWDNFIDAIDKVAERLLGPYNIEVVVEPLNIKISEAIMNFQESGTDVSKKIYSKCGAPQLRKKRKAEYTNPDEDNPNFEIPVQSKPHGKKKKQKVEKDDNIPDLDKLIMDIKQKIKDTKQFWKQLPFQYCNNEAISASPTADGTCWNGTTMGSYNKPKFTPPLSNSPFLQREIHQLKNFSDTLQKAHQGQEVDIVDDNDIPYSGSGNGPGSGDGIDDDTEDGDVEEPDERTVHWDNDEVSPPKVVVNKEEIVPPIVVTSTKAPEIRNTSGASSTNSMSLLRALIQYILPIVLVWFGGAISDCL